MATSTPPAISEPFPIFQLAHRYLLYDAATVAHARAKHNICGVLIGSLPQAPQQNVFLGLPLELMPEEARLLVSKRAAYIVDEVKAHKSAFLSNGLGEAERRAYHSALRKQGLGAAREATKRTDERKKEALKQKLGAEDWNDIPEDMLKPTAERTGRKASRNRRATPTSQPATPAAETEGKESSLFAPSRSSSRPPSSQHVPPPPSEPAPSSPDLTVYPITPTTSHPPLPVEPPSNPDFSILPPVPPSYPLYTHLHSQSYFLTPGLRFGCQYTAYPGDPLRFHSHFLCAGMGWDEEFDLMDLVAGGRLGTGVKKGFLVGGREEKGKADSGDGGDDEGEVRTFCIEWGGM